MRVRSTLLSIPLGLGMALAFLFLVKTASGAAPAEANTIRCVKPGGGGGCYATIQAAVNASSDGDEVRVAEGEYHERVQVPKSVLLQGGWDSSFTTWSWLDNITTLNGDGLGPVVTIDGTIEPISPTIEGFYITNGDASSDLGWGGGILAHGIWGDPGLITIRSNVIYDNVACKLDTCQGYGGGIMIYSNLSIIEDNIIQNNIARADGHGSGYGGGVAIWGYPVETSLSRNVIAGNTAVISPTGVYGAGEGGGLWSYGSGDVVATNNWIRENVAAEKGTGRGGGVYAGGSFYSNEILTNTASVEGSGYGGGVYGEYVIDFHDNLVSGNMASQSADGIGGGIYAVYLKEAGGNTISKNRATSGGGVYFSEYTGYQSFYENKVSPNTAGGTDVSVPDGGGGIFSLADRLEITGNQILTNTGLAGGGLQIITGTRVLLQDNLIQGNLSVAGGGLYLLNASGEMLNNRIDSNGAIWWGGGLYLSGSSSPRLDGNMVVSNTAAGYSGLAAGGVAIAVSAGTHVTMTNSIIANNTINSGVASGVHCLSGSCSLIHCTIVDNKFGIDPGEGVRIGAMGGENVIWNSILAGHSTGVVIGGSPTVSLDYNAYYDNAVNVSSGASSGPHALFVDPLFVDRLAGDYRLGSGSPLINAGDSHLSLAYDFQGQPRPLVPDIGADEFDFGDLFLPLLVK